MGILKVDVDSTDFDWKIRLLRDGLDDIGPEVISDVTHLLEEELKAITPVRSGKLLNSIRSQVFGLTGEVSTNSGYGLFVDVDTKPHIITGNPFLRFEVGNRTIYARKVFHPGTKGQHLRLRTLENSKPQVKEILSRMFLKMFEG